MNQTLNQNDARHHGFIYQNPNYIQSSNYRQTPGCERCKNFRLATIYVKPQLYKGINSPADALKQGTAFSELYRPFVEKPGGVKR